MKAMDRLRFGERFWSIARRCEAVDEHSRLGNNAARPEKMRHFSTNRHRRRSHNLKTKTATDFLEKP